MHRQHAITSDEMEYPLSVFPQINVYAQMQLGLKVKIEKETPYGWQEIIPGEPLFTVDMRWRMSFFKVEHSYIPTGIFHVKIIW